MCATAQAPLAMGYPAHTTTGIHAMDFALSDEQEAVRETARRFSQDRIAPGFKERDGSGKVDRALVAEMGSLGLIGADLPEAFGGSDAGCVTAGLITEQVGAADLSMSYVPMLGSLMGRVMVNNALPDVAEDWVGRMVRGEVLIGLGLTEPRGGSDAANVIVKAEKSGNGYVINGEKASMSLSDQADAIVLFARTGDVDDGARGVSAFLVPMDEDGITKTRYDDMGEHSIGRGSVFFDNVRVPASHLLDEEGMGFVRIMQGFDYSRALIGLQCIGAAQASLDEAWAYSTEREAFDRPIAQFQGVTFPLAEAETLLTAARLLCYHTLDLRDRDKPHTAEAAMCKWFAPKSAVDIIHQCLLTHGHFGYTRDLPHEQRLRDVIGLEIGDGTAQIMKMIIAREKIGRVAVQYAADPKS
jgi:cyclohexanecarboxyl-CoA dehydrogenase